MRGIVVTLAALATGATLYTAVPAAAQTVGIRAGEGGVSVRVGEDRRDRYWHRRDRVRHVYRDRASCRETTVRTRRPDGTVVIRKRSTC